MVRRTRQDGNPQGLDPVGIELRKGTKHILYLKLEV